MIQIDAVQDGEVGRRYVVATFWHPRAVGKGGFATAYLRDYNTQWDGCVMYEVLAVDGRRAKQAAERHRRTAEREERGDG